MINGVTSVLGGMSAFLYGKC